VVEIKDYRKDKSREQLGYLFGVVLKAVQVHIEDSKGERYTTDDLYAWFCDEFCEDHIVIINGKPKVTKVTASKMNTAQMADFITRVIQFAADELDVVVPWPEVGMQE